MNFFPPSPLPEEIDVVVVLFDCLMHAVESLRVPIFHDFPVVTFQKLCTAMTVVP